MPDIANLTIFPIGNADTLRLDLEDGRKLLFDYADTRDRRDAYDRRCDLPALLRNDLERAGKQSFEVVCFTHLDEDHTTGAADFFYFEHATKYQDATRIGIDELWVPAAAVLEARLPEHGRVIRQEARHRLRRGSGIKVFSRPEALGSLLADWGLAIDDRRHCIVNAGHTVPGFALTDPGKAEFFVHAPFAYRADGALFDRNQGSVVLQATVETDGAHSRVLLTSDVDYQTLGEIIDVTLAHGRPKRLGWDIMKLPHHCSYTALGPDIGRDETAPVDHVAWLFERQGAEGALILSPSDPIPTRGSVDDRDKQPPHRQAAAYYRRVMGEKRGRFMVSMEHPSEARPTPIMIELSRAGPHVQRVSAAPASVITSRPARAG